MCLEPNLSFGYVGGKIHRGDLFEAKVAPLWLVFVLRELLADRKTICPKRKLDPLKSHFRFPGVYQVKRDFICCAQVWNNIDKLLRYIGGKIRLRRWENWPGGLSQSLTHPFKPERSVEISRIRDGFSECQSRPSKLIFPRDYVTESD